MAVQLAVLDYIGTVFLNKLNFSAATTVHDVYFILKM
jgi:hypothetical protein